MFTKAGMLSQDGRCKTLDASADGYVRAEAVAAMMLQAVPAGSGSAGSYAALVLGSAVNQDGRSSGLTAPNGPAQQTVLRAALTDAGLQAPDVTALFMHGTGTPLGEHLIGSKKLLASCCSQIAHINTWTQQSKAWLLCVLDCFPQCTL
jgi:acyl transferase domain-containing protein